jgi:LPS-assembly protein
VDLGLVSEWVDFSSSTLVNGQRAILYPSISMPMLQSYAFVTPKVGIRAVNYTLTTNNTSAFPNASFSLPIVSVDSGLIMERETQIGGNNFLQTLEPRLYYLNIPYRDQSQIPNFDSALATFNYAQMFSENKFVGGDRINDANQITAAISSRLLDPVTGQEWLRATLGEVFYFKGQQVTLPGGVPSSAGASNLLAAFSGRVAPFWNVEAGVQYDPSVSEVQQSGIGARYQPEPGKVLNFGYRYTNEATGQALQQVDASTQWPLSRQWQGLGRVSYSLISNSLLEGLAGLEYNAGCWAARMVAHQFVSSTAETSKSVFFQIELFGLGSIGSNPLETLKRNIPGYARSTQPYSSTIYNE